MESRMKNKTRWLSRITLVGAVATALVATACSKESSDPTKDDQAPPGSLSLAEAARADSPLDATPDPQGENVYYIAFNTMADEDGLATVRVPAIFKVSAAGGPSVKLHEGAPLVSPSSISISDDGQTLFIADGAAESAPGEDDGSLFSMGIGGGAPTALSGTQGYQPRGIEVMGDTVWFTGKKDGKAALFKSGLGGGQVSEVASGALFTDPSGVAVTKKGVAYVVDSGGAASAQGGASVIKVEAGVAEVVMEGLGVGHPAGAALTADESTLLVSGLDVGRGTDVVYKIELASKNMSSITDVIGDFRESAGLHRARGKNVFAWADSNANGTGTVYKLEL